MPDTPMTSAARRCPYCGLAPMVDPASAPEVESPEWVRRRKELWDEEASNLMAALVKYEDEHPDDAICLAPALESARRSVVRA